MSKSAIEWTDDTWNPVSGCTRVSAGCDHCYAVTMTKRLEAMGKPKYAGLVNIGKGHFNGVVKCHEDALLIPLKARKPRRWFVNSMSDLFHRDVPFEFISRVFSVMALTPHHTYQILTKRPERMAEFVNDDGWQENTMMGEDILLGELAGLGTMGHRWPLRNVWIGTSVEDQSTADERIPHLLRCPAAVRFLSCEPLLGPVMLRIKGSRCTCDTSLGSSMPCFFEGLNPHWTCSKARTGIHWVIVGGESGPGARPMHPDWARSLRDQCVAAGVPYFFKQWGEHITRAEWCADFADAMLRERDRRDREERP